MTNEEINTEIAVACGWGQRNSDYDYAWTDADGNFRDILDYCGDLNAISEAVNFLNVPQREIFIGKFHEMTAADPEWLPAKLAKATPRQWSEAFLRTLGKWRDEP